MLPENQEKLDALKKTAKKYRKRPVIVEAFQTDVTISIETLEGIMIANPGDWIIIGVKGEMYPCKPDVFEETYEKETGGRMNRLLKQQIKKGANLPGFQSGRFRFCDLDKMVEEMEQLEAENAELRNHIERLAEEGGLVDIMRLIKKNPSYVIELQYDMNNELWYVGIFDGNRVPFYEATEEGLSTAIQTAIWLALETMNTERDS